MLIKLALEKLPAICIVLAETFNLGSVALPDEPAPILTFEPEPVFAFVIEFPRPDAEPTHLAAVSYTHLRAHET